MPAFADGEVVSYIEPKNATNPAPTMRLDSFQRFEAAPIAMDPPYAGQKPNEIAKESIQANLDLRLQPVLADWNAKPVEGEARALKIEPTIRHVRFITGGKRFFAGGLAGGSAVLMTVKLSDASTGEVIAEPEFYQHANKMGAAWSFGATDKAMLIRVAAMVVNYLKANYSASVGGSTTDAGEVEF
ncbi:hypothetical protein ACFPN1_09905 [Lysobacter yangpyeongensis]|uniref:DUF4410 domain-containing protein n=1 Tax=Lysobacter yangpyeongensis TaxID=346182 RepID=A0ABW0SMW9_9GAMM